MVVSCSAFGCTNRFGKRKEDGKKLQFHKFPLKKPVLLKKWIIVMRRESWEPSSASVLCAEHFRKEDYKSVSQRYLKDDAVPSIFNFPQHRREEKKRRILTKHPELKMPKNCFVPGCKTTFKNRCNREPGEKSFTLFSAPKDPVLRKQWNIASRRGDREMTEKDTVCELHFTEDCLLRHFTTKVFDGSTFKLERSKPALKKGSIPTIFPFSNSGFKEGKRKKFCRVQSEQEEKGSRDFDFRRDSSPPIQCQVLACSAYGCTNSSDVRIPGLSFHRFPTDQYQKAWMRVVRQKKWMSSEEIILCSAHFTPDQIEHTGSSVRLKFRAIPTIFSSGEKLKKGMPPKNIQTDKYDSSDSDRNEHCSTGIFEYSDQNFDKKESHDNDSDSSVQEESDETPEYTSSSNKNVLSTSENFIAEGHEKIFGKFVASELKILACDPPLYLRTMEKIWQVLEGASQKLK